ncbi:hypothetical protein CBS147343_2997 [Aspergillus niger]|nr:hypothetical protein CBS133816_9984 [Aspergillus niger]KAI2856192.1 hypothetical protein CBS12448_7048 [Aspergillus niger]KAI2915297.1 hypothetical protein CBS147371_5853 [Aspergillus niger]KAI2918748.1 hypothetical protein CBS147320_8856 [Aspergillus niger]KAI2934783.1 hypothetical protein CBS147321_9204 [Aspergillus niger]
MASLANLPLELLRWVAEYLTTQRDISHLMQTTKRLYHTIHPLLCEYNIQHDDSSALVWAAQKGNALLVDKLLAAGANIAAYVPPARYIVRKIRRGTGADPWAKNNPLLYAAQGGHMEVLGILLAETRSGHAASSAQLRSVLHWALRQHDGQLVERMLAHKAPLDPATEARCAPSALGVAVAAGYKSILPRLLDIGAWPGLRECPCPTEQAVCNNRPDILRILLDHGIGLYGDDALCHIAHNDDRSMLQLFLEYDIDLVEYGSAALFTAIRDGHYEMAELLIDNGALKDVSCDLYPPSGLFPGTPYSAVGFAILYERVDILRLLLEKGFLPAPSDLDLAKERNFDEAVSLLAPFAKRELHYHLGIANWHAFGLNPKSTEERASNRWHSKYCAGGIADTSGTREPEPDLGLYLPPGPVDSDGDPISESEDSRNRRDHFTQTIGSQKGTMMALITKPVIHAEIVDSYGNFTFSQFYSWNPAVKSDCSGLQPDFYVCIGVAGSTTVASQTTFPATTTPSAATSTGSYLPEQTGIASSCMPLPPPTVSSISAGIENEYKPGNKYYYVQHGDTCSDIATNHDISLNDFYSWNPAVGTTCSDLEADYWVCVGVSGGATATTTTSTSASTSTVSSTTPTSNAPSPTQSGLVGDCSTYYEAKSGDSCWSIVNDKYTYLTTSLSEEWNPAVGSDCSNLQPGYYYCVATQKQAPMPDTIDTCKKWHLVSDGDNCWSIEQDAGVTASQFNTWNPADENRITPNVIRV